MCEHPNVGLQRIASKSERIMIWEKSKQLSYDCKKFILLPLANKEEVIYDAANKIFLTFLKHNIISGNGKLFYSLKIDLEIGCEFARNVRESKLYCLTR